MTFHALLDQTLSSQRELVAHLVFVSRRMWVLAGDNPAMCTDCVEDVGWRHCIEGAYRRVPGSARRNKGPPDCSQRRV